MDKCTTAAIQYLPTLVSGMHNWKTHLKFNDLAFEFTQAHETSNTNQNNLRADLKFAGWQCQLLTTLINNMAYIARGALFQDVSCALKQIRVQVPPMGLKKLHLHCK